MCLLVNLFLIVSVFLSTNLFIILLLNLSIKLLTCLLLNLFLPVVVRKSSIYNYSLGATNECVHVSVNNAICKDSVTFFSGCTVNIHCKMLKVVLTSVSVNTVSAPPVNVVKITTTPTYQYSNLASKHAVVHKSIFSSGCYFKFLLTFTCLWCNCSCKIILSCS